MSCYRGEDILTEEQLQEVAENCIKQRDFLQELGKEFVIFIAPNKGRIYYDKMSKIYGEPAENYRALQIYNYLKENTDLRVVYPYDELIYSKENIDYNIYYKTDSHWNTIGGYVGTHALMKELGIDMPAIDSKEINISVEENTAGDLAQMLNLTEQLMFADNEYKVSGYDDHQVVCHEWTFGGMINYTATDADPRTIYVYRDSYGSSMSDYIGSQFNSSFLRHRNSYTYEDFLNCNADIFVYETVERYAYDLSSFSVQ